MKLVSKSMYSIKQGIKGIFSNKMMAILSIVSVASSLIILGIVLTLVLNVNQFINIAQDEINEIRVSVDVSLDKEQKNILKSQIRDVEGIKDVIYKTKEESFESMKDSWGEDAYLLDGVKNPLDDYFVVTIENPVEIKTISSKILTLEGTKDVEYYQDIMNNFLGISSGVKKFSMILMVCLLLICLVIISNTIKSRVYSKKEEIQIIKYVGASNGFVIAPFIVEGFLIGLLGALISVGACVGMYGYILDTIAAVLNSIMGDMVLPLTSISTSLVLVLVITGIGVGVVGSVLSVKRHLKV